MKKGLIIAAEILLLIAVLVAAKIFIGKLLSDAAENAASYVLYVAAGVGVVLIYRQNAKKDK